MNRFKFKTRENSYQLFRGMYGICLQLIKKNRKITQHVSGWTWEHLGFGRLCSKIFPCTIKKSKWTTKLMMPFPWSQPQIRVCYVKKSMPQLRAALHIDQEPWLWKSKGPWESSQGRTMGNGNPNLQSMDLVWSESGPCWGTTTYAWIRVPTITMYYFKKPMTVLLITTALVLWYIHQA